GADPPPDLRGVLPYAAGEDHTVKPAKAGGKRCDLLANTSTEHRQGVGRAIIHRLDRQQVANIRGGFGKTQQTRLAIDQVVEGGWRQLIQSNDARQHAWVKIA